MSVSKLFQAVKFFSTSSTSNLKFVQFTYKHEPYNIRAGYIKDGEVVDLNRVNPTIPNTMLGILRCQLLPMIFRLQKSNPPTVPLYCVNLCVPIHDVDKVIGAINNYKDFCVQKQIPEPEIPIFFNKFASTLTGHNCPIYIRSGVTNRVDWEIELCVVIGSIASNVSEVHAEDVIMGYTIAQDITARDWSGKANGGQATLAKNMDSFTPLGPCIVSKDEIRDVDNLTLRCRVNGICKQESSTNNMIYKIPKLIQRLTSVMTLYPGDLILTGTPGGTGELSIPVQYLRPGDELLSEIDCIGILYNKACYYC